METLTFAAAMEKSIGDNIEKLGHGCSLGLQPVLHLLVAFHREFEMVLVRAKSAPDGQSLPELDTTQLLGPDETWRSLSAAFSADTVPDAMDYTVLWSIHAMLDKSTQFYQQASRQSVQPHVRLFFGSIAELKGMLRRRMDGIERIAANQVWKAVGFPPGLLGKE